jgi:hypothetical protein
MSGYQCPKEKDHLSGSGLWSCHAYSEQKDPGDHTVRWTGKLDMVDEEVMRG